MQVLIPKPFNSGFDYAIPPEINVEIGDIVHVPFGKKELWGCVISQNTPETASDKIRSISQKSSLPSFSKTQLNYMRFVAKYTMNPLGMVLAMMLPVGDAHLPVTPTPHYKLGITQGKRITPKRQSLINWLEQQQKPVTVNTIEHATGLSKNVIKQAIEQQFLLEVTAPQTQTTHDWSNISLTPLRQEQEKAESHMCKALDSNKYNTLLLDGVTGSGKTEVYFHALLHALKQGKQILVLLPEIALTNQLVKRFSQRFGTEPCLWHSGLTQAQRRNNYRDIATGKSQLIIGARSAVFLPYPTLGLIIVDEEHENAYKQEDGVLYHGRNMAVARAHHEQAVCVLVSASPSLESYINAKQGKYQYLSLKERHFNANLPDITLLDMRRNSPAKEQFLAPPLLEAITQTLEAGQQAMLYLNRRGYAPLTLCRKCGFRFGCSMCSTWLVQHQARSSLSCHHCGHSLPMPSSCPDCKSKDHLAACGPGVERIAEEVGMHFKQSRIAVLASDTSRKDNGGLDTIIADIEDHKVNIIIGTQMVAKGHHFKHLTLVGVVDADIGLEGGDIRASERAFQLLCQVSGRAGREGTQGKAIIQSYMPEHPVMQALKSMNREQFFDTEIARRERGKLPPFNNMVGVIISCHDETLCKQTALLLKERAPKHDGFEMLGPAPAPIYRLRGKYRNRLLVRCAKHIKPQQIIKNWLDDCTIKRSVQVKVDIDPVSFY